MKQRQRLAGLVLGVLEFLCSAASAKAQISVLPATTEPWTPKDMVLYESAGSARISPDAQWAVWVKNFADKEKDGRYSNLYLTHLTDRKTIQLTRGSESQAQPRWSPKGKFIAFLSDRKLPKAGKRDEEAPAAADASDDEAAGQIWLINPAGGEPWPLTKLSRDVQDFAWADDDAIVFSAEEDASFYEQERKTKKDDSRVVDDDPHTAPVRLFRVSVSDEKIARLTRNTDWIRTWDLSPDGTRVVALHQQKLNFDFYETPLPIVYVHDLKTGTAAPIFTDLKMLPFFLRWTRDGAGIYAVEEYSKHPVFHQAYILRVQYWNLSEKKTTQVDLHWNRGLASDFEPDQFFSVTHDGFFTLLADGFHVQPAFFSKRGDAWTQTLVAGEHARNLYDTALSLDEKALLYNTSTSSTPPQWYAAKIEGAKIVSPAQFTDLNPQWKNRRFAKTELIRWKGAKDEEIEGILYYPFDYQPGKKYPLVTGPHGGPSSSDYDMWNEDSSYPSILHVQRGAFYLRPNYHGSANYGLDFVESIGYGNQYDLEIPDMEKGVDFLIAKGLVDSERIGAGGWSYGGIITIAQIVENPSRYKVATVGAANVEYISDWGNIYYGHAGNTYYLGKTPFEDPQLYVKKSPFFRLDRVTAPTLIYTPAEDVNVSNNQGWSHFRAMQYFGKAPVKFIVFPGEPHGLKKLSHRIRKVEEDMAWFDRYLYKIDAARNEALKPDAPLADAFQRMGILKHGTRYGIRWTRPGSGSPVVPILTPEMVKRGELAIGRFEITAAQFAEFRKLVRPAIGFENRAMSGITLEDAQAYVGWLSQLTKQIWRLPYEDEVKDLYEKREGENTLDYWAGYAPSPGDAAQLREEAKKLGGTAPLLKEVGSFHGQGKDDEEPIYDLGGNVAEWVLTRDGKGKVIGGSADCPAESKSNCTPAPEYIGFRVIRGAPKEKK